MTTTHAQIDFIAGDDWQINATLLDENGAPFDLSGTPNIKWTLNDGNNGAQLIVPADVVITVTDAAAGKCTIGIPAAKSSGVRAGIHRDALRLTVNGEADTLAIGPVHVTADPFK